MGPGSPVAKVGKEGLSLDWPVNPKICRMKDKGQSKCTVSEVGEGLV